MGWYQVTKRIHGHFYLYWQRTYRLNGKVKTENKYIGPVNAKTPAWGSVSKQMENVPQRHKDLRAEFDAGRISKLEYLEAITRAPLPAAAAFKAAGPFPTFLDAINSPEYKALVKENKAAKAGRGIKK